MPHQELEHIVEEPCPILKTAGVIRGSIRGFFSGAFGPFAITSLYARMQKSRHHGPEETAGKWATYFALVAHVGGAVAVSAHDVRYVLSYFAALLISNGLDIDTFPYRQA